MKRHAALIPLSHDHQHTLAHALRLRRASSGDEQARAACATEFLAFADAQVAPHFTQEEELLDQACTASPDSAGLVDAREQVRREHDELRAAFAELRTSARPSSQQLDLVGEQLQAHVRYEERIVFELLQEELGDELDELTRR
jgi:hypothetical protein